MNTNFKAKYYLILCRPLNVLIGMLSIFIGALISGTIHPLINVLLACVSGGFIAGAANVINDYYDVEIDKINKPYRPIAAGKVTRREGFYFSMILFIIGVGLAYFINWKAFSICIIAFILLFSYSAKFKRTVLWGNLIVSLVTALAFIYGGIAVNRLGHALIPAIFSFFYHLGREIIKDVEDIAGDRADKIQTIPIRYDEKFALKIAMWIYIFLIFLTIMPYVFNIFGNYYLVVVLGIVDVVVVYVLFSMFHNPESKNLSRLSVILKLNMFTGLVAIYLGKF